MPSLHHYLNVVVPRSVRRADALIADSHHTAQDLTEQWQVAPERITVVQGAVDHERFRPLADPVRQAAVRARYGLGERPYILGLSRLEPRKNFVRLIEAFHRARHAGRLPQQLVIGGGKGWLYDAIFARVAELGLEEHVRFPGFIAEDGLACALQRGRILCLSIPLRRVWAADHGSAGLWDTGVDCRQFMSARSRWSGRTLCQSR